MRRPEALAPWDAAPRHARSGLLFMRLQPVAGVGAGYSGASRGAGRCRRDDNHRLDFRRRCPAGCWISRVTDSVPAIDDSTLRHFVDADLGWANASGAATRWRMCRGSLEPTGSAAPLPVAHSPPSLGSSDRRAVLHVARVARHPGVEDLDDVRRPQRPLQQFRQAQPQHRQRLVELLADRRHGAGILVLEQVGQAFESPLRARLRMQVLRPAQRPVDAGVHPLRKMIQHVPILVHIKPISAYWHWQRCITPSEP